MLKIRTIILMFSLMGLNLLVLGAILASDQRVFSETYTDIVLRRALAEYGVDPLEITMPENQAQVDLGQALFFDKLLSGNQDISCATCHHPDLASADGRALSVGVGGHGLGDDRVLGEEKVLIPRSAPEIFNRGSDQWVTMFWDGRVAVDLYTGTDNLDTPAGDLLPVGLDGALAGQALFPPTSRHEMRGEIEDGNGLSETDNLQVVWEVLNTRILDVEGYQKMYAEAYPDVPLDEIGIQHAANAIAAFEIEAFTTLDSPFQNYLLGDDEALSAESKSGARLFYGKANCASCHSGSLMTDQAYHNIGVPVFGPGKEGGLDVGRYLVTEDPADKYAFRTPPLTNIALTGPYMHNGAYETLKEAVRHHLNPVQSLERYNYTQLETDTQATYEMSSEIKDSVLETLDEQMTEPVILTNQEFDDLMAFLESLTASEALSLDQYTPKSVPSGLSLEN